VIPRKRVGSGKTRGGSGKSVDSRRFEAQRRAELETPPLSICPSQGNLSISSFTVAVFHF
jgi:hypothetical protein